MGQQCIPSCLSGVKHTIILYSFENTSHYKTPILFFGGRQDHKFMYNMQVAKLVFVCGLLINLNHIWLWVKKKTLGDHRFCFFPSTNRFFKVPFLDPHSSQSSLVLLWMLQRHTWPLWIVRESSQNWSTRNQ